jgi:predicted AAA+ superfamily ATPase
LIERKTGKQYILTGSSTRKLKRTGVDLLAGRAVVRYLPPLMASELGDAFLLDKALKAGMLPLVLFAADPMDTLRSYVALYLREEVQMEGLVRNIGNFSRFLEMVSFSHGSVLNVANVARECQVERKTVTGYLDVLKDLLLSFHVPPFTVRAKREVSVHEKFYLFDAGVYKSLRPSGPLDRLEEIEGPALEGLVAQHLKAWIDYRCDGHQLYFWRTRSGVEVDFVVYGPEGLWAVEVKNSASIQPHHLSGLRAFGEEYPDAKRFLVYRGRERLLKDGVLCIPCEEFLRNINPLKLIEE